MIEFWPVYVCCTVVAFAAGWASRFVPQVLIEREWSRELGVGAAGASLLLMATATAWIFGAPTWLTNVVAIGGGLLFLYGFAVMTKVSREFAPLQRAALSPDAAEDDVDRLLSWLQAQKPAEGLGELRGHQAEVALALLAGGHQAEADALLAEIPDNKDASVAERTRIYGARAVLAFLEGDDDGVDAALDSATALKHDFVSTPHLRSFRALLSALRGRDADAMQQLEHRGVASGSLATDRWARINALCAAGDDAMARNLIEAQQRRHGPSGVVPLIALRGPAEDLARSVLGGEVLTTRLARAS